MPSFTAFAFSLLHNPVLCLIVLLVAGVIFVNGWTDAPNAIATCISTRCMRVQTAIWMSAAFNFLGVLVMTLYNATVASTMTHMVNFSGDTVQALTALCAALTAIIIWAVAAWAFGIPTSESHALIAGLSGAAVALQGGWSGIHVSAWLKVLYGLLLSTLLGFAMGYLLCRAIMLVCYRMDRTRTDALFKGAQIVGGAAMSFMHGAQDGQKFMGVLLLALALLHGQGESITAVPPLWMMLFCSIVMGLGTSVGGKKIIKSVGMGMVRLERYQGFSADVASALCLLLCSLYGIPVSTTHTKTTAIMGAGVAKRPSSVRLCVVREMVLTWFLTFPGCGLIGFIIAQWFMSF